MKPRFFLYAGLLLAVAAGGAALLAIGHGPIEEKIARWTRSDAANVCIDVTRDQLRSPISMRVLRLYDSYIETEKQTKVSLKRAADLAEGDSIWFSVLVEYEAENGFGASARGIVQCEGVWEWTLFADEFPVYSPHFFRVIVNGEPVSDSYVSIVDLRLAGVRLRRR